MGEGRLQWFCFFLLAVFHIGGSAAQSLNEVPETQDSFTTTTIIKVVSNLAVCIVVVAVGVVVIIVCWRKGRCQPRRQQQPPAEIIFDRHRDRELCAAHAQPNENESPYDEILDDRLPIDAGVYSESYSDVPSNLLTGPDCYLTPKPEQRSRDLNRPITRYADQIPRDQKSGNEAAGKCSNPDTYTPLLPSDLAEPGVYSALKEKTSPAQALDEEIKPSSRLVEGGD